MPDDELTALTSDSAGTEDTQLPLATDDNDDEDDGRLIIFSVGDVVSLLLFMALTTVAGILTGNKSPVGDSTNTCM